MRACHELLIVCSASKRRVMFVAVSWKSFVVSFARSTRRHSVSFTLALSVRSPGCGPVATVPMKGVIVGSVDSPGPAEASGVADAVPARSQLAGAAMRYARSRSCEDNATVVAVTPVGGAVLVPGVVSVSFAL